VLDLLLTVSLASLPLQAGEPLPTGFAPWLLSYRGEHHLAEFIQHERIFAAAEDAGLLADPLEVELALSEQIALRIENAYAGDRELWLAELTRLGLTEESWRMEQRAKTLNSLLINRLVQTRRELSEPELVAAWEERYGPGGRTSMVRWIQIAIAPPTPPPGATRDEERALREAARESTRLRAEEVKKAWRDGGDFAALQRSAGSGDEPKEPFRLDELVWPGSVRQTVAELVIDEVTAPLSARGGWSLIQLVSAEKTPLGEVRDELVSELSSRPANSAETDALFAKLEVPVAALPQAAFGPDPLSSTLAIAHLDERPVLLGDFTRWLLETRGRPHLDSYHQMQLVERLSEALGASFSAEEIVARRESDLQHRVDWYFKKDRALWLEELLSNGRTFAGWRRAADQRALHDLRAEALLLARRTVSAEELVAEWEERHGPNGYARTVRWILLTPPQPPDELESGGVQEWLDEQLDALHPQALELRRRAVEGGEDFGVLARRHSADPSTRAEGGLLSGIFDPRQQPEVIARAVEPLKTGGVSQPVQLLLGFGLYQVQKIEHTPFEEVEAELREALMTRRPSDVELASFVNQLFEESKH